MSRLNLYGNHRGGTSLVTRLPADVASLYEADWTLADPKEDRAAQLAMVVRQRFPEVRPRPLRMTAQQALAYSQDDDTLVLTLDTVAATKATLAARRQTQGATFQLIGRGPGGQAGVRTAVQGTLVPGDHDTAHRVVLLLDTLERMTREASSRVLTGPDPLTASILRPMRDLATRQTICHLAQKDWAPWELSRGPLSVLFGPTVYPLVPVQGPPQAKYAHRKALALDVAGTVPARALVERGALGRWVIVAVVVPEDPAIHFMTVVQHTTGKRRVDGVTILAPLPDVHPALFTD
jgi:hypothetical protein